MSNYNPTEKKFENHIEKYFNSQGFKSINYKEYNRDLCLIKSEILNFIKSSQKKNGINLKKFMDQKLKIKSSAE